MFVSDHLGVNQQHHLTIGGVDTIELAEQFHTPLFVMDEDKIRDHCRQFRHSIEEYYQGAGLVCYASKAFCCKQMYRIAKEEGIGTDVVSMGELYTAMSVDFPVEKICYHGNNKTPQELEYALECGVGRIVVDNLSELHLLNDLAGNMDKKAVILLRVTPGIDAHTHQFIRTGQLDSKFGLAIELGLAMEAIKQAIQLPHIVLDGIHCHIGSQIFDIDPFEHAAEVMLSLIAEVQTTLGFSLKTLNLGGGFGIQYTDSDDPVAYDCYMKRVSEVVKKKATELGLPLPYIIIEPGRSIVGPAGITLYTVGNIKEIPNIRKYLAVDGGMTDNPRYALYQAEYDFLIANRADAPKDDMVTVAGRCCESGDLLGEHIKLQSAQVGDILAVCATGAYNYAMSSHYNRVAKPAVVMVSDGVAKEVVRRETLEDLTRFDI